MLVVEIIGNLGGDATIKEFSGQKFISFSVAHTESYNDGQGQKRERTTWISCLKHGESAVINYLKKGTRVFLRGELSAKVYNDGSGTPQVGLSCRVRELQLLGGNKPAEQQNENREPGPTPAYSQPEVPFSNDVNDDLPF
jgi:single-strand DNA-binding protein